MIVRAAHVILAMVLGAALLAAPAARANPAQRTFVSVLGSDLNPCSVTAPCRGFQTAIANTIAGGEVVAVDSGGFGTMMISGPIQVIAPPGVHAAVFAPLGIDGVNINTGVGERVVLRGLYLSSPAASINGIMVVNVGSLLVDGVTVTGFLQGLRLQGPGQVTVIGSTFRANNLSGIYSVAAGARLMVAHGNFVANGVGIEVSGTQSVVTVTDSTFSGHGYSAIDIQPGSPATGAIFVERCTIAENATGISAAASVGGPADVYVSDSTITHNSAGVSVVGSAHVYSRGNNTLEYNDGGNSFTGTYSAK